METLRPLNYFSSRDFLTCDLKAGVLRSRGGTRMIGINDDFLRGFVLACEHETGPATALILRRCGQFFGQRLARRFEQELGGYFASPLRDRPMLEFDLLLRDLFCGTGLGELSIDWASGQHGFLSVALGNSPMQDIGPKGHIADDLFCGAIEGFFSHFASGSLSCIQTGDARLGDKSGTTFVLATSEVLPRLQALVAAKTPHAQLIAQLGGGS
jgi:hypothetical protein